MTTLRLVRAELLYRKSNVAASLLALSAAATLFVAGPLLIASHARQSNQRLQTMREQTQTRLDELRNETDQQLETMQNEADQNLANLEKRTKRIMRDLGFNLRIVHRDTDMTQLFANYAAPSMPQEYIDILANSPEITKIAHLVATIKQMVQWEDQPRLLVGFAPETVQAHVEKKPPMGFNIKPGTVYLGHEAGKGREVGQKATILGKEFTIAQILAPEGNRDRDILIGMHLKDAQQVLDKPQQITEIIALGCKCKTVERVEEIQAQLEAVLPQVKVRELRAQAIARDEQRKLVTRHYKQSMEDYKAHRQTIFQREQQKQNDMLSEMKQSQQKLAGLLQTLTAVVTPLVILVCAVWTGLLTWNNVRERRMEIGLLRALGKTTSHVAALFLGKAVVLGLAGGLIGCVCGLALAWWIASSFMGAGSFSLQWWAPALAVVGAPLVAAMASYLPTLAAVSQDPAIVLMDP